MGVYESQLSDGGEGAPAGTAMGLGIIVAAFIRGKETLRISPVGRSTKRLL